MGELTGCCDFGKKKMQIRAIIFAGKSRQLLDEFTSTWCVLHYTMNKTDADCDDASVFIVTFFLYCCILQFSEATAKPDELFGCVRATGSKSVLI